MMPVQVSYHGPYQFHRHRDSKGTHDCPAIRHDLIVDVPHRWARTSGVYIYLQRTTKNKWLARYVGINTTKHILDEALSKSHILEGLDEHGSRWLLLLTCKRPAGMGKPSFERVVRKLEKALIRDLALKGHPLKNKIHLPKNPHVDFAKDDRSKAAVVFKRIVKHRPPYV